MGWGILIRAAVGLATFAVAAPGAAAGHADQAAHAGQAAQPAPDPTPDPAYWVYPARSDVCGTGDGIVIRDASGTTRYVSGGRSIHTDRPGDHAGPPCETGMVVVAVSGAAVDRGMRVEAVRVESVRVISSERAAASYPRVGGTAWLSGQEAADRLLESARGAGSRRHASRLVLAAVLAGDAVVWPALLEIARDRSLGDPVRKSALQWLGRRAGDRAAAALGGIVRDRSETDEIRDAAVFGLSQLPADRAVPALIEVVRTIDDPRVRSRSLFWLSEFDDPRVLALFEEILTAPEWSPGSGSGPG